MLMNIHGSVAVLYYDASFSAETLGVVSCPRALGRNKQKLNSPLDLLDTKSVYFHAVRILDSRILTILFKILSRNPRAKGAASSSRQAGVGVQLYRTP